MNDDGTNQSHFLSRGQDRQRGRLPDKAAAKSIAVGEAIALGDHLIIGKLQIRIGMLYLFFYIHTQGKIILLVDELF